MKGGFSMNESKKINSEIIDINGELLYTISEVAKLLKVNRNYVYALINGGYIRSIKLGCRKVTKKCDNYMNCTTQRRDARGHFPRCHNKKTPVLNT